MDMMPRDVRPGLLAAFARATELGVDVQKVERVLRAALAPAKRSSSSESPAGTAEPVR
jgi:hypothetical protein